MEFPGEREQSITRVVVLLEAEPHRKHNGFSLHIFRWASRDVQKLTIKTM